MKKLNEDTPEKVIAWIIVAWMMLACSVAGFIVIKIAKSYE